MGQDTTIYLLEWLTHVIQQCQMLMRIWSGRNSHVLIVRMHNSEATWEDSLQILTKMHIIPYNLPKLFTQMSESLSLSLHKKLSINLYSSYYHYHNCQNLEATKVSFRLKV
jgi:hypothetical protein